VVEDVEGDARVDPRQQAPRGIGTQLQQGEQLGHAPSMTFGLPRA